MSIGRGWFILGGLMFVGLMVAAMSTGPQNAPGAFDPLLLATLLTATYIKPRWSGFLGLASGVIAAGLIGSDMTGIAISRAITVFILAKMCFRDTPVPPVTRAIFVLVATGLCRLLLMFMAPPPNLGDFLRVTIGTAAINGALAWLLGSWMHRLVFRRLI
jgi:hypothetical protein